MCVRHLIRRHTLKTLIEDVFMTDRPRPLPVPVSHFLSHARIVLSLNKTTFYSRQADGGRTADECVCVCVCV